MINYILKGHTFAHEVQTIIQVFYANKNYHQTDEILADGITVISDLSDTVSKAQVYKNGELVAQHMVEYSNLNITPREKKRVIKMSIYMCLKEMTGYIPKWGMITGIRPAKTVNELFDNGWDQSEARSFLVDQYFVSEEKADLTLEVAKAERNILSRNTKGDYSIYIGIPFCPTRCLYCSFTSYPLNQYKKMVDGYLDNLIEEITFVAKRLDKSKLMTIYIGGGTPTSLNEAQLERLLCEVKNSFATNLALEYTVEAGRPDTITREKLEILKKYGVSRISINPQTMNQKTLDIIGRKHTVEEVRTVFEMAREVGFDNINMDLILGLPEETIQDVVHTMEEIYKLNPDSLTVHTLAVKRASRLKEKFDNYTLTESGLLEKMIEISANCAEKMNMKPYYMYRQKNMIGNFENVGYCREGMECIYNVEIMEEKQTIIALGAGGTTKVYDSKTNQLTRVFNVKSVEDYTSRLQEMLERKQVGIFT
ncbi:MAG TPA: coproporphyrinogen dehydrogenase HemZ [Lachnospiraceae bacterium]|nr:coproporphyrinogen dehydrogenase HemZ [Lachnospiraceae bacterium]